MSILNTIGKFITDTLDSSSPQSFGRFAALLTLVVCLTWDTSYVWFVISYFGLYKFTAADILPAGLTLLAQGGFCTLFYGSSKVADVWANKDRNDQTK